jgi:serine protease AprX
MIWPTLRDFLRIPAELTGKGIRIAVLDGDFPNHPDITTNERRTVYKVMVMDSEPQPRIFEAKLGPWKEGAHGLWATTAAAGSGAESQGLYKGVAPEADLFLIAEYFPGQSQDPEGREAAYIKTLEWVRNNWQKYEIRAVVTARQGPMDSGLLPWQTDPIRILCEEMTDEGLLVMAGSGNTFDYTARVTAAAAPSVLSVGGIAIPPDGNPDHAGIFQGCRGTTFEGKWVPEILGTAENVVLPHGLDVDNHYYGKIDNLPRRYARLYGTSYSGPVVLGAAACLWQAHSGWTASEMKTALIASSLKKPQWSELRAGLVSVQDALAVEPREDAGRQATSPYMVWSLCRKRSLEDRIDQMSNGDSDKVKEVVLSFVGDALSEKVIEPIRSQVKHPDPHVRTAALCALASRPALISPDDIKRALQDSSPNVRMAAIHLLRSRSDLWPGCAMLLARLFDDTSLEIRVWSLDLARKMGYPDLVENIVANLEEDARLGRISNFATRIAALEAITGQKMGDTGFMHGQPMHIDEARASRMDLAHKWEDWLRQNRIEKIKT